VPGFLKKNIFCGFIFVFEKKIRMHSGVLRVARSDSMSKAPPLAARMGSPEAPGSKALPQWTVRLGHMNVVLKCI